MTNEDISKADAIVLATICSAFSLGETDQRYVMETVSSYGINEKWFRETRHKRFFEAVTKVWKERSSLDGFLVVKAYEGRAPGEGVEVFESLSSLPAVMANLDYYCQALKNKNIYECSHRLMLNALKEIRPDNIGTELEDFVKKIHELQENMAAGDDALKQLGDYMAESLEKKWRLHEERFVKHNWEYLDGLRWPWKEVDQIFAGLKTGLHILAALASQGKSTMAVDLSVFWNEIGVKHGFFSIDMAADQLADRYPCVMNRVSLAKLNFGGSHDDLARFKEGYEKVVRLNNVWLSEVDDAKKMEYQCYRGVKTLGWKAIIIDYIQLVHSEDKGQVPEYTRVQHAVQAIKAIAKKLKVPIVCLAQLSRAFEQQLREKGFAPGLDAIGDSAEIARAAASVTCLYQDEAMKQYWSDNPPARLGFADPTDKFLECQSILPAGVRLEAPESEKDRMARRCGQTSLAAAVRPVWFDVKKNQQGRCGKIPFVMFPNYFLFRPGNSDGGKMKVMVAGKEKDLPVQMFEQLRDDWTYSEQDWFYEMINVIPQRGVRLMGETQEQMQERMVRERNAHPEVAHFIRAEEISKSVFIPAMAEGGAS